MKSYNYKKLFIYDRISHLLWFNDYQARQANLLEWVWDSLDAPFIWPCATFKQKKVSIYMW